MYRESAEGEVIISLDMNICISYRESLAPRHECVGKSLEGEGETMNFLIELLSF